VPVSAGPARTRAYRGTGQSLFMNATPNNALHRTRARPAGGRSPLSFKTFGARGATVKVDATDGHVAVVLLFSHVMSRQRAS
jgi:hypothetical protein